jgi:dihydroorotase
MSEQSKPVLIRGGHLVDPANNIDAPRDIFLRDGLVAAVESPNSLDAIIENENPEIIDASNLTIAPGLVDIHVHLREPGQEYKETIATGTAAAAAGGFTTVCCMPNTVPVNDTAELTAWMQAPERNAVARVFPIAAATVGSMGEALTDYAALRDAGAVAVSDDGKPILGDAIMKAALLSAAHAGLPVIQHAEDTRLTGGCSMHAGPVAFRLGLRGMSIDSESNIVERDVKLLAEILSETGLRPHLHVAHISTARALQAVKRARQDGLHVSCEVAPHHFALTDEAVSEYDTNYKMNPPLRAEADRAALLEGLMEANTAGSVNAIATDHAPHAAHEKEQDFIHAPNGITGLETALGLALKILHRQKKVPLSRIISLLSTQPAAVLGLDRIAGKGSLSVGAPADVVLFDPAAEWVFHARRSKSRSKNTPFDGWRLPGPVHFTISQGRILYRVV